ncbi:unnamed protein product [Ilex paraguariensis]|uniref:Uncharacterized protein n=1 Tax=Ilex paraguariensis TaxID=185542 RepID=A0ABC8R5G7_9AQUA
MASIAEGPLPFKVSGEQNSSSNPTDAVIFVGISLVLGIACRHVLRGTRVPYTAALLVLGIGMGSLEAGAETPFQDSSFCYAFLFSPSRYFCMYSLCIGQQLVGSVTCAFISLDAWLCYCSEVSWAVF